MYSILAFAAALLGCCLEISRMLKINFMDQIDTIFIMQHITLSEVPYYLRSSPFFLTLLDQSDENDTTIDVPAHCLKATVDLNSNADLHHLLETARFWLVPEIIIESDAVLRYVLDPANKETCSVVLQLFERDIPQLTGILAVMLASDETKMRIAADFGAAGLLAFMHDTMKLSINLNVMVTSAAKGHLSCLHYLLKSSTEHKNSSTVCKVAAERDHFQCLQFIISEGGKLSCAVATAAAGAGNFNCLKLLHDNKCPWDASTTRAAAHNGQLNCLQFSIEQQCAWRETGQEFYRKMSTASGPADQLGCLQYMCSVGYIPTAEAMITFASSGHLPCVQFLLGRNCPFEVTAVSAAICNNHLSCVRALADRMGQQHFPHSIQLCNEAAKRGLCECLLHLRTVGCHWGAETVTAAASGGHLECLLELLSNGCDFTPAALVAAAEARSLPCMIMLSEAGCPWNSAVLNAAMRADDVDCLEYALHCCPYDNTLVHRALQDGSINCLRHLHTIHICPWTLELPIQAAELGNLTVLRFLHESGCPWDDRTCAAAAASGSFACFNYAYAHGCPCTVMQASNILCVRWINADSKHLDHFDAEAMVRAACHATPLYLRYLHSLSTPWDGHATMAAARHNLLDNLKYLHDNGCMWDENAFRAAVVHGHVDCVKYMFENNCPFDFMQATNLAAQHGHVDVLKYLREKRLPWSQSTCAAAAAAGHLHCLTYLHQAGCPWDHDTCIRAGTIECYDYAVSQGCPGAHLSALFSIS